MAITIQYPNPTGGLHPLYRQYPGQSAPQPAHVELDCEQSSLRVGYSGEIGNAVTAAVYHGRVRQWCISESLTSQEIIDLLNQVAPLAERVAAGYTRHWDEHNHVGRLTEDATVAEEEAERICEEWQTESGGIMWAGDWFEGLGGRGAQAEQLGITAQSTDAELAAMAERLEAEVVAELITLDGAVEYLATLRDYCVVEAEAVG